MFKCSGATIKLYIFKVKHTKCNKDIELKMHRRLYVFVTVWSAVCINTGHFYF